MLSQPRWNPRRWSIRNSSNSEVNRDTEGLTGLRNANSGSCREKSGVYTNDFAIIEHDGETYGCPRSFNRLTAAWFLNESSEMMRNSLG